MRVDQVKIATRSNLESHKRVFDDCLAELRDELEKHEFNLECAKLLETDLEEAWDSLKKGFEDHKALLTESNHEIDQLIREKRSCQKSKTQASMALIRRQERGNSLRTTEEGQLSQAKDDAPYQITRLPSVKMRQVDNLYRCSCSDWYDIERIGYFFRTVRFGDVIEFKFALIDTWAVYVGDAFGGEHMAVHIRGDILLGHFSSASNSSAILSPIYSLLKESPLVRINNSFDENIEPSSASAIHLKIENELIQLKRNYNAILFNDQYFVKYIRNGNETNIFKILKFIKKSADKLCTYLIIRPCVKIASLWESFKQFCYTKE